MTTNARNIATAARGAVIIGSGLALGFLTAHVTAQAVDNATSAGKQTTKQSQKSVDQQNSGSSATGGSGPGIVYRDQGAQNGGSGLGQSGAAPQPAPAAKQPAAKSKAS